MLVEMIDGQPPYSGEGRFKTIYLITNNSKPPVKDVHRWVVIVVIVVLVVFEVYNIATPYHFIPNHPTLQHNTPFCPTPHHTTSYRTNPQHTTPHHFTTYHSTPNYTTPLQTPPRHIIPQHTTLQHTTAHRFSREASSFLDCCFQVNVDNRWSAKELLKHEFVCKKWFQDFHIKDNILFARQKHRALTQKK